MGHWKQCESLYGPEERWVPQWGHPHEWPADPEPHNQGPLVIDGVTHGPIPEPCADCIGRLTRRISHFTGKDGTETRVLRYSLAHFPHEQARAAAPPRREPRRVEEGEIKRVLPHILRDLDRDA